MKFLVFNLMLVLATSTEIIAENFNMRSGRIASGFEPKKGEYLEFCYLTAGFFQKSQSCGCMIITERYVGTSARCVVDCNEGTATNVTVTFPQKSGKDAVKKAKRVIIPDGNNGDSYLPPYFAEQNLRSISAGNIALIEFDSDIGIDGKTAASGFDISFPEPDFIYINRVKKTKNYKFRACGVGVTDNKGTKPKGIVCTEVKFLLENCKSLITGEAITLLPGQYCLQWPDRDNNVCVGDYGGAIYGYEIDSMGKAGPFETLCTLIGSPDVRPNAPCLDGHTVICELFTDTIWNWIRNVAYNGLGRSNTKKMSGKKYKPKTVI